MIADVLVELKVRNVDKCFSYNIPDALLDKVKVGIRVNVPFGKQSLEGIVLNIRNEKSFFDKYVSLNEIYVLGHSLADVDLPYFEKIARESSEAKWYVSYRDDDLKDLKRIAENTCKIPFANDVKLITLDELKVIS